MANITHVDAVTDAAPHHNHKPVPIVIDKGHSHDVFDVAKHLISTTGEKGASVTVPQLDQKSKEHDSEAHFTTAPKDLRGHLKMAKEK